MEDYITTSLKEFNLSHVIAWASATVMIFGGVVPFIPQYREIKRKGDAEGFSLYVCLVLLISNILRILFWCGKKFETPLLIQSMIMTVAMFFMIHVCVSVKNKSQIIRGPDRLFTGAPSVQVVRPAVRRSLMDFEWRYFWQWTDFWSYVECVLSVTLMFSLTTFVLRDSKFYIEALGFAALFTEAMLAVPQLVQNFRNKSTEGMSVLMVVMWLFGDCFKTTYFILRDAPAQFWLCGSLQIVIDIFILGQVYWYNGGVEKTTVVVENIWYTHIN
ncbi:solute carrier family 66 member 2-like isoform X2 [Macrosteles quadrilineatus]|uniref:solute carrier family 66 member 2-like isoform X2 n=1 Tax=Macrosteles quadrilineatus TaxID=74068 RepID=UPI0023E24ABA|nr:solute carrier family 66 member 2-like isoform X2 [Macrosteles quadrilineatus]XP_054282005.1 solute carrier family 66 member 2-like isoform X2 [Macrosteles quadrilineatus]XP_054282006.1 solute carrier family 66 member 2-like isoform X2 [Macrosteles quadrilineatus]XP_054282133.1 solute carrier family 66 member 2-like isoform X2 [Macrosteles quadrilineatus]XP_054282134.1 solute carrier family 66 member 2-like isoform X2 [Macrosteles quadrilineatus]XP_054282135.1 solute carrier family 66 membe